MVKKALLLGIVSGLIASVLIAANVYLFHIPWLWLVLYIVLPTAITIGMTSLEHRIGKYLLYAYVFLFTQACIVGLFELPIYKYWVNYRTPAGAIYSRYEMDAFYPILGLVFVLVLPLLISFPLWITNKARVNSSKYESK